MSEIKNDPVNHRIEGWMEFCRVFCEALKEDSEKDKETPSVIDRLNQSQVCQTSSLINETILKEKEKKDEK